MKLSSLARVLTLTFLACPALVQAQAQGTQADYDRSAQLAKWSQNKVFRATVVPHWNGDGDRFWYKIDVAKGEWEFVAVDAVKGSRGLAFDHAKMAAALAKLHNQEISAKTLPLDQLTLDPAGAWVRFSAMAKRYECALPAYELREIAKEETEPEPPTKAKGTKGKGQGERIKLHPNY